MKILLMNNNVVCATAHEIIYGTYENEEKYGLYDEDNQLMYYYHPSMIGGVAEVESLPSDYTDGKYLYINGTFTLNPDYVEPLPPIEDRVTEVEGDIADLTDSLMNTDLTAVEMYEELLEQSEINMAQDETLIEMYEMLNM